MSDASVPAPTPQTTRPPPPSPSAGAWDGPAAPEAHPLGASSCAVADTEGAPAPTGAVAVSPDEDDPSAAPTAIAAAAAVAAPAWFSSLVAIFSAKSTGDNADDGAGSAAAGGHTASACAHGTGPISSPVAAEPAPAPAPAQASAPAPAPVRAASVATAPAAPAVGAPSVQPSAPTASISPEGFRARVVREVRRFVGFASDDAAVPLKHEREATRAAAAAAATVATGSQSRPKQRGPTKTAKVGGTAPARQSPTAGRGSERKPLQAVAAAPAATSAAQGSAAATAGAGRKIRRGRGSFLCRCSAT